MYYSIYWNFKRNEPAPRLCMVLEISSQSLHKNGIQTRKGGVDQWDLGKTMDDYFGYFDF